MCLTVECRGLTCVSLKSVEGVSHSAVVKRVNMCLTVECKGLTCVSVYIDNTGNPNH